MENLLGVTVPVDVIALEIVFEVIVASDGTVAEIKPKETVSDDSSELEIMLLVSVNCIVLEISLEVIFSSDGTVLEIVLLLIPSNDDAFL